MADLPKKHKSHKNQEFAKRQLRAKFGNDWNIGDPKDIDSGIEYGLDFLIEVVTEKGEVTGQLFGVQSKVLNAKSSITSTSIGTPLKVTTINYLNNLAFPILLHFINERTGNGYVMWLHDWLNNNSTGKWRKQKEKRINIPLSNLFDNNMVKNIIEYIDQYYFIHNRRKLADLVNKHSKDHHIEVKIDYETKNVITVIQSLHQDAIAIIKPLDAASAQSLKEVGELGGEINIQGRISISNLPSILFDGESSIEAENVTLLSNLEDVPPLPVRLTFRDDGKQELLTARYLEMRLVHGGAKLHRWEGESNLLGCSLQFDDATSQITWTLSPFANLFDTKDARKVLERFQSIDAINMAQSVEIELLSLGHVKVVDCTDKIDVDDLQDYRQVIEDLVLIMDRLNIEISAPAIFSNENIEYVKKVVSVLRNGVVDSLILPPFEENDNLVSINTDFDNAKQIVKSFEQDDENKIVKSYSETTVNLFGTVANLGASELIYPNAQLYNKEEVVKHFENESEDIELVFTFDKKKAITRFLKWLPLDEK